MTGRPPIGNRDANEPAILREVEKLGVYSQQMPGYIGYDCLWFFRGRTLVVEIKNPEYLPKSGTVEDMLTDNEQITKILLEQCGVDYNIILTLDDALELLGLV